MSLFQFPKSYNEPKHIGRDSVILRNSTGGIQSHSYNKRAESSLLPESCLSIYKIPSSREQQSHKGTNGIEVDLTQLNLYGGEEEGDSTLSEGLCHIHPLGS